LDAERFERLGHALRQLKLFEEAGVVLDKAVAEFPNTRRLRFSLAQTLNNLGRYDDAEVQYKILLDARPSHIP
jgi:predicted Zn-dependent protease